MQAKKEIVKYCRKVYEKGFVAATDGNLSIREGNLMFITPSGISKGDVTEEEVLLFEMNNQKPEGNISTEYKLHLEVYKNRSDINAVVHCHPVYASAFSLKKEALDKHYFPEVILSLGKIPVCEFAVPSTKELAESIQPYIKESRAFLLANHGALTIGADLKQAYYRMEKLEHYCHTLFIAQLIGNPETIPDEKMIILREVAEKTYGIKI